MKNTGFSLVELLVVIAIMAILAGVAVPVYSSYTESAKVGVDEGIFNEIAHVANLEAAREGKTITIIEIGTDSNGKVNSVKVAYDSEATATHEIATFAANDESMIAQVVTDNQMQSKEYNKAGTWVPDTAKDGEWNAKTAAGTT